MINLFRRLLIRIGKIFPFIICLVVSTNYFEIIVAMMSNNYIDYGDNIILDTKFSFMINRFIEYDILSMFVLTITSIAVETCIYNKLSCVYLWVNLFEKSFFEFEMDAWLIYLISISNILVAGFLLYKGLFRLNNS